MWLWFWRRKVGLVCLLIEFIALTLLLLGQNVLAAMYAVMGATTMWLLRWAQQCSTSGPQWKSRYGS